MRLGIRARVLMVVSIILVLIFTAVTYIVASRNVRYLSSSLNEQSKSFTALTAKPIGDTYSLYKDSGTLRITQKLKNLLELDTNISSIRIVSIDGTELFSSLDNKSPSVDPALASSFSPQYVFNEKGYINKIVQPYFEDSGAHRYSVVYNVSTQGVEDNVNEVVRIIIYIGLATLTVTIAAAGLMLNFFFIKPLKDVSASANLISSGDYDRRITSRRKDEIGDLAGAVEKMADSLKADIIKLQELDKLKSEFMMITSHNLRTPITIMEGYMELANTAKTPEELKGIISTIQESVTRLHLLAENVLTISTLETGRQAMSKSSTPLASFVDSVASQFALLAEKKSLKWNFNNTVPAEAKLAINLTNMRSALGNLIDNAIKFTKSGGSVTVEARLENGQFVFRVTDSGIGISPEETAKLFTKFHRGTSTLSYDYEGIGIGLYLSKLIIEQHDGRIEVKSEPNKGSAFTVSLPLGT